MNHEHDHLANHAQGLPAFFSGIWVAPACRQGIAEDMLGGLETQPMIPDVAAVFCVGPYPAHVTPPLCSYTNVVTEVLLVKRVRVDHSLSLMVIIPREDLQEAWPVE
jgi:hypothetical protein